MTKFTTQHERRGYRSQANTWSATAWSNVGAMCPASDLLVVRIRS